MDFACTDLSKDRYISHLELLMKTNIQMLPLIAPTLTNFKMPQDAKWAHFDLIGQILCFPL